jgi:hypothetical protein
VKSSAGFAKQKIFIPPEIVLTKRQWSVEIAERGDITQDFVTTSTFSKIDHINKT